MRRAKREAERLKVADGGTPIERFNAANRIDDLLERYGYLRLGQTDRWQSPHQTSGTYATKMFGDYWVSLSGSDADVGLGTATKRGDRFGDGFDLYVAYEHAGNFDAAVRSYDAECDQTNLAERFAQLTNPTSGSTAVPSDNQVQGQVDDTSLSVAGADGSSTVAADAIQHRLPTPFQWVEPALIPPRP